MKLKSLAFAALVALGVNAASAATYNLTGTPDPADPSVITFSSGNVFTNVGSFSDTFNFTWTGSPATGLASSAVIKLTSSKRDINFLTANLFDALNGAGASLGNGLSLDNLLVTGNNFSLVVTGTGTGSKGGQYILTSNVSPVPEPESYAMMLAGLAAVGFMASRRRQG